MNSWTICASEDTKHPNRHMFKGILTRLDEPSDKAPAGGRGHRMILTHTAAKAALPGLIGQAIDFKTGWDGHDARQKCGIITSAEIVERDLCVGGYIYARDYKDVVSYLKADKEPMGMSYELADAHVADMRQSIWKITRCVFTGAAILLRSKAAYRQTSFELVNA